MATLNFIRGTIRGKLGQFVGSSWKGKSYIKTFTKPGNPKTAEQVAVRSVFQNVSHVAKSIYENILKPYTFPKPRRQTAYNRMIQINKPMFDSKAWDPAGLKIFEGPLANHGITNAAYSTDMVIVDHDSAAGEGSDKAIAVVFDSATGTVYSGISDRNYGTVEVTVPEGLLATGLHAYLAFAREPVVGTSEKGQVSNTAYKKIT